MFSLDELNRVMRMDYPTNRIIRWQPAHLYMCQLNAFDEANLEMFGDFPEYLETYAAPGHAFTAMVEDDVMAMFGVWQLWPGVCEAWLIPNAKIKKKTVAMHRGSLAFFEYAARQMQTKRLQFTVHTLNVRADRWAARCHFKKEGLLKHYGPDGADYWMYARIFK